MKTAKLVKRLEDFTGYAALYKLSEPLLQESFYDEDNVKQRGFNYVIVSKANVPFSGPETYIFGASKDGEVLNWSELPGSARGLWTHDEVLERAGYTVA